MIGQLRTRLGIYKSEVTRDELGGETTRWVLFDGMWAAVQSQPPVEKFENGRHEISVRYKVTGRYRSDFPERARLLWGETTLRVIAASDPDGRRERLHLICEEERQ